ncbi:MAG TPA: hypothetical protein VHE35_04625, partial [Kofleriaceae bacterium]|nr:hypothetical protein [Kofleriaceae bacterium]
LELTWGVVVQGAALPLQASGAVLGLRDRIYVRVVNTSRDTLYVHLFDVGTRRKVARLSGEALFGVEVRGHEGHTFGATPGGALTGFGLAWPDGVPREPPRPEELYVIAARRGVNLGALETEQAIAAVATRGGPVGQARAVGTRDASALRTDGYLARRIELTLRPVDAALASADAAVAGPRD